MYMDVFAADGLGPSVGYAFSTSDENNSGGPTNCGQEFESGWWFTNDCGLSAPNDNDFLGNPKFDYWNDDVYYAEDGAPASQLKIRPCASCPS